MNFRGITNPPKKGVKQLYKERIEWRWYQKYLPENLQIHESSQPYEEWWSHKKEIIHIDRYKTQNPKAKMIILHGAGGNGRILSPFALMAVNAGCEVVAPDLPGYGLTVRSRKTKPTYKLWSEIASDLASAELKKDALPVFVWGLSIGGFLAYMVAAKNTHISGLIATTFADTRKFKTMSKIGKNSVLGGGGFIFAKFLGPIIDPISLPVKWLSPMHLISNDPEISRVFMRDKLAGGSKVRMGFLRSLINAKPYVEPEEFDHCPVLLVHPEIDPWTPLELSKSFFDKIKGPKQLVILEGCGHLPIERPGRNILEMNIIDFVQSTLAPATK